MAKILGIDEGLETESDQTALIDKICEKFQRLEAIKNGSKIDINNSDSISADRNGNVAGESHRSSKPEGEGHTSGNLLSPHGTRGRKKQPKQSKLSSLFKVLY